MQRCAILALEGVPLAETAGRKEDIRSDNLLEKPVKLFVGQLALIELLKLLTKIGVQRGSVADVKPKRVL